ncbi:hypothetical protein [Novosphingobium terrae]|uniref:hypothetical protein n=1 Tax=Novosphingobium terrae TaxID=2726189 RepID=UPI001980F728|nr:hypothetical protein [Novosphingobium terrae]
MNWLARVVLIMVVALALLDHLTAGGHPALPLSSAWKDGIALGIALIALLAGAATVVLGIFKVVNVAAQRPLYSQRGRPSPYSHNGASGIWKSRAGHQRGGIEIRRGSATEVMTRAECNRPTGWCSVAYFLLDGQPARMVCQPLEPYSRSPLPAPFSEGDELIIAGKSDSGSGRFVAVCSRLIRQGVTIDLNPKAITIAGGLVFTVMGFYPIWAIVSALIGVPIGKVAALLQLNVGAAVMAAVMSCVGLLGLFMLVHGGRLIWVRRMLDQEVEDGLL